MARIILCPGQGAQVVGMGKAWFDASPEARGVFAEADGVLAGRLPGGQKLSELCFGGPAEVLNRTDVSQPAIYTTTIACWRGLLARWGCASAVDAGVAATAGLSLGEYSALQIAGVFSFQEGLNLVALRGRAMQEAAEGTPSGMIALIGADEAQAQAVCTQTLAAHPGEVLVPANFNAPGQIVLSGSKVAVGAAEGVAVSMGLRGTVLQVAGAFHSPIMRPAADRLARALAQTPMQAPACPVMSNVTAQPHGGQSGGGGWGIEESIRGRLVEQLMAPVRWSGCCEWLLGAFGGAEVVELAPGRTLAGLMRRINKGVKVQGFDEPGV